MELYGVFSWVGDLLQKVGLSGTLLQVVSNVLVAAMMLGILSLMALFPARCVSASMAHCKRSQMA
jgi:hypothetical protein